jgi:hypothetical protein
MNVAILLSELKPRFLPRHIASKLLLYGWHFVILGGAHNFLGSQLAGIAGCSARAPSGHAAMAPITDMNSRRFIAGPKAHNKGILAQNLARWKKP